MEKPTLDLSRPGGGSNSSPIFFTISITHRKDAVYPATIVGIPPMEDFYIGGASVKLFLPIFKMNFPEIVDIALPAEGVFQNLMIGARRSRRFTVASPKTSE
jgi:4-hydroxy-3-polyprenylbenzoate decarboxylase